MGIRTVRGRGVVLAAGLALIFSMLGIASGTAAPASAGWHEGWCQEDEGLSVVVDFGEHSDREVETRCRVGGTYPDTGNRRKDVLESVGYEVTVTSGMVSHIDGIGDGGSPWWKFSVSEGVGGWVDTPFEVPADATNWFQGVCLSQAGCYPSVEPQFGSGTGSPGPVDPGPTNPSPVAKAASKPKLAVLRRATTKRVGRVRVWVPRVASRPVPGGRIVINLRQGKKHKQVKAPLAGGKVERILPKMAKGVWKVVVRYQGNPSYKPAVLNRTIAVRQP